MREFKSIFKSSGIERFRKPLLGTKRDVTPASREQFNEAMKVGIQEATKKSLSIDTLKDHANVVKNWIENNKPNLEQDKKTQLDTFYQKIRSTFKEYRAARFSWTNQSNAAQKVREATQKYCQYVQDNIINDKSETKNLTEETSTSFSSDNAQNKIGESKSLKATLKKELKQHEMQKDALQTISESQNNKETQETEVILWKDDQAAHILRRLTNFNHQFDIPLNSLNELAGAIREYHFSQEEKTADIYQTKINAFKDKYENFRSGLENYQKELKNCIDKANDKTFRNHLQNLSTAVKKYSDWLQYHPMPRIDVNNVNNEDIGEINKIVYCLNYIIKEDNTINNRETIKQAIDPIVNMVNKHSKSNLTGFEEEVIWPDDLTFDS